LRLPRGYWGPDRARPILEETQVQEFEVSLDGLEPGERRAVDELLGAARTLRDLAEDTEHQQGLRARSNLQALHERLGRPSETTDLLQLHELFQGPIATTLENERLPFLPVDPHVDGRNVYPWGIASDEIEAFLTARPDRRPELLDLRTVVRRTDERSLRADLATLRRYPLLDGLHPGLRDRLERLRAKPDEAFYALPYSVRWPERMLELSRRLSRTAEAVQPHDADFAAFLRHRSRDLLADDYEAGDAAWVRGSFGNLDAVVGAYEPYDDDLFGAKAFFGLTILRRDAEGTAELLERMPHLQAIEDALPVDRHRRIAEQIPVGTYDVIASVAQGVDVVAEILPNDAALARKYGRKILLRRNYMTHPAALPRLQGYWRAAVAPAHHDELSTGGMIRSTAWHEIGHHLGPDLHRSGRAFADVFGEDASVLEELKSELVSTFSCIWLHGIGLYSREEVITTAAGGTLFGLRPARPLRTQPYQLLGLMRLNHALESGYLRIESDGIHIDHDRLEATVTALLREVLAIQDAGTHVDSSAFIERYSTWDDRHERIAAAMRSARQHRYVLHRFPVLDGPPAALETGST
jgi:hypothetical protein